MGVYLEKGEPSQEASIDSGFADVDIDTCGCHIWDEHSHCEHLEAFYYAAKCAHECALDKVRATHDVGPQFVWMHLRLALAVVVMKYFTGS